MRAVVQRVKKSHVEVEGKVISQIQDGLLVLLGVEQGDTEKDAVYLADKISGLRIFEDEEQKMNLSVKEIEGELLVISQFTLLGDCRKGKRPSFQQALAPKEAKELYFFVCKQIREQGLLVQEGIFGADMQVSLCNDGPVTILLDSKKQF